MHSNSSSKTVYDQQKLDVGSLHSIHIEQSGNPDGIPVLYLHGGPGAGLGRHYQWPFERSKYRIIGFDQRGCGRSSPFGSTEENTTDFLLQDIEMIRQHLKIEKWIVFGGSWGSTLALLYSIKHPKTVIGLVLRGVFLARIEDFEWFLTPSGGAAQVFPDAYSRFTRAIKTSNTYTDICAQFIDLFKNEKLGFPALQDWYNWEGCISRLVMSQMDASDLSTNQQIKSLALLECHYVQNQCFISEGFILNNIDVIQDIPCHIVHGRYDMVCKVEGAYALHRALPKSQLSIVNNAGHSMSESGIAKRLVHIMQTCFAQNISTP